jgi:hypothetical protein
MMEWVEQEAGMCVLGVRRKARVLVPRTARVLPSPTATFITLVRACGGSGSGTPSVLGSGSFHNGTSNNVIIVQ